MARFFVDLPLHSGGTLDLPEQAARHVQVLRLQPGQVITLFNGLSGEFAACIERITRSEVRVQVGEHQPIEREAKRAVHLAVGMPANERMDWLVEKATELGVASIQPLMTERSVLRLAGERAHKKQASWRSMAIAACEQCGRNRVPLIHPVQTLAPWLTAAQTNAQTLQLLLSLRPAAQALTVALASVLAAAPSVTLLSGPEGGLSGAEEDATLAQDWLAVTLGSRVLRAETAPLTALAVMTSF